MPPRNKPKDSKNLRQTTLFGAQTSYPAPSSIKPSRTAVGSPLKKKRVKETPTPDSSSDEISDIKMTPATGQSITIQISSDEDQELHVASPSMKTLKRRKIRVSSGSGSSDGPERDRQPVKKRIHKRHSSAESQGSEEHSLKRPGRLRRRVSSVKSSSEEDIAQLAQEVDEDSMLNVCHQT